MENEKRREVCFRVGESVVNGKILMIKDEGINPVGIHERLIRENRSFEV